MGSQHGRAEISLTLGIIGSGWPGPYIGRLLTRLSRSPEVLPSPPCPSILSISSPCGDCVGPYTPPTASSPTVWLRRAAMPSNDHSRKLSRPKRNVTFQLFVTTTHRFKVEMTFLEPKNSELNLLQFLQSNRWSSACVDLTSPLYLRSGLDARAFPSDHCIPRMPSCFTNHFRGDSVALCSSSQSQPFSLLQNDEDQRELGGLRQELARAEKTCQELEDKNQVRSSSIRSAATYLKTINSWRACGVSWRQRMPSWTQPLHNWRNLLDNWSRQMHRSFPFFLLLGHLINKFV